MGHFKPGRNQPCPCGSGKKYKKCHGSPKGVVGHIKREGLPEGFKQKVWEQIQRDLDREREQGLGRPIISTEYCGYRFVAVGKRLFHSQKWGTFHEFLVDYLKIILVPKWGDAEQAKPEEEQHPIIQWHRILCENRKKARKEADGTFSGPMGGAESAYLHLAYNLYLLGHNEDIQKRLIRRLRDKEQFYGACYETYVAAALITAGFKLEFEEEDDPRHSHCEFTAEFPSTSRRFSVEAKSRLPNKTTHGIGKQLYAALSKEAKYERIVFININISDCPTQSTEPGWVKDAVAEIQGMESTLTVRRKPAPPAYVFVTNHPFEYDLEGIGWRTCIISQGYKIPDYKRIDEFVNPREAIEARKRHIEIWNLVKSISTHYDIPASFDGSSFPDEKLKFRIGGKRVVPDGDGGFLVGELVEVKIDTDRGEAHCAYMLENGSAVVTDDKMSEEEVIEYKENPHRFFGGHRIKGQGAEGAYMRYEEYYEEHKHLKKSDLVELLREYRDPETLREYTREELLGLYCECRVYAEAKQIGNERGVRPCTIWTAHNPIEEPGDTSGE